MIAQPLSHAMRSRCLLRKPQGIQGFSTSSNLRGGDHGSHYDPPTGWLFGIKPGQKYAKEGWEGVWYYGFIGSLLAAGVAYVFKPDTSYVSPFVFQHSMLGYVLMPSLWASWMFLNDLFTNTFFSIQTWALEEARRRLEAEGILEDPQTVKK
ncbi:NADH-ubiquinone oxidoreductase [Penicillium sp. IBT 18751x]|nr:NADH-ubiquinone oxidoreductase [Penicillium sp. IBT 18751x]